MSELSFLLIIINVFLLYKICRDDRVHTMLKIVWCISYLGWSAIPLVLTSIPLFADMISVPMNLYLLYANVNQIALFLINLLAYTFIKKLSIPRLFINEDFQNTKKFNNALFWICSLILVWIIYKLMTTSLGYRERNDVANMSSDLSLGFMSLLEDFSVFILLSQIIWQRDSFSKKKIFLSSALLSLYVLMQIYNGRRVYLFFFVIVLLYMSQNLKKKKYFLIALIVGGFSLWLLPIIATIRQVDRISTENITSADGGDARAILSEIINKTNSVQYSCYLLEHDGIGTKGATLYTSTLFALIPRALFPEKPVPGSIDGTLSGIPARLNAIYHRRRYNDIENNGITSSLEALWAMGWGMYLLQILITGYLIFLFNGILCGGKPLFVYFMFSLIGFPVCVIDVSLVKVLLGVQRYIFIYLLAKLFFNRKYQV